MFETLLAFILSMTLQDWIAAGTGAVTVASIIAFGTPTPKEGSRLAKLYRVIDWAALNVGKAKDRGDVYDEFRQKGVRPR